MFSNSRSFAKAEQTVASYDARYERDCLVSWPTYRTWHVETLLEPCRLPRYGRVLDHGCGQGTFIALLEHTLPGWQVFGTDISGSAIELTRQQHLQCRFVDASVPELDGGFEFIFTHHVLEHVRDLGAIADRLCRYARPACSMLHILACGNPESFEHWVSSLRKDGVHGAVGKRFFHNHEGHLRRLTSAEMIALWADRGFRLRRAWYANHVAGAIKWLLDEHEAGFLSSFADPSRGVSGRAPALLLLTRVVLLALWVARKPAVVVESKLRNRCRSLRDAALLLGAFPCYPPSKALLGLIDFWAAREWTTRQASRNGTEMYLYFSRLEHGESEGA